MTEDSDEDSMLSVTRRRATVVAAAALAGAMLLSACQQVPSSGAQGLATPGASASSASSPSVPSASVVVTPSDGATKVRPDEPITVAVTGGLVDSVVVQTGSSDPIPGEVSADGTMWTSSGFMLPRKTYTVTATARNLGGVTTTTMSTLKTLTPTDSADYYLIPSGGGPVGVGMPVAIQFAGLVDKDKRAAVEKRVSVTTEPSVDGAWGWLDGRQLIWRPAEYWKPGTTVTVRADIAGVETRKGIWTSRNASTTFTIGDAMVSTVNTRTHRMTVTKNGKTLRVLKVSTGRPGSDTETRNGIKVILSRESSHTMDSATIGIKKGDKDYYNIKTQWAMRLTWSGEFLHSAPWSVGSQGNANVSHGCTNLSPSDAKWLFDHSRVGDVVKFTGSSRKLEEYNGYTMWNMSLAQWATHSAVS